MATALPIPLDRPVLVSDFDGTMTRRDFYQLVEERLSPQGTSDWWSEYQSGRISHFDALRQIFGAFPAGEAELIRLAHAMDLDPDLAASVTALREAGWEVVVASAGCEWYIPLLLNEAGVDLPVHANPGHFEGGRLVMEWPSASRVPVTPNGYRQGGGGPCGSARPADRGLRRRRSSRSRTGSAGARCAPVCPRLSGRSTPRERETFQPFGCWSDIARKLCMDCPFRPTGPHSPQ